MPINVATTVGFPNNTGGIMRLADVTDAVDNVFIFLDDAGVKWERITDGPYSVRWAKIFGNGTNYLSAFNVVLAHSRVSQVLVDLDGGGSVTLNGTLACAGKTITFMPNNSFTTTTTLTVDNAIIDADYRTQIFGSTSVTLTNAKIARDRFSTCWYSGAASGADQVTQIQKAADSCILNGIRNLYTPAYSIPYSISKGVLLRKDSDSDGVTEQFSLNWEGDTKASAYGLTGDTALNVSANNTFAIGYQKCKGLRISGFKIEGTNTNIQNLGSTRKWCEDQAFDWIGTCRNNTASPYAAIVGDIGTSAIAAGNRYPTHTAFYTDVSNGGSTDVIIENCAIRYFVVGIALNPAGIPQNGDIVRINNVWLEYLYAGISTGESQNRSVICTGIKCWGGVETLFDTRRYGDGTSCPVEVDGCNIAGGVRYLTRLCGFGNSHGMSIRKLHAELLYSLGGNFDDNTGDLFISDSWIQFTGNLLADGDGTSTHHPITMFRGGKLTVTGNSVLTYYSSGVGPMAFCCKDLVIENTQLDCLPINNLNTGQTQLHRCKTGVYAYGEGERIDYIQPNLIPNQAPYFITGMEYVTLLYTRDKYASIIRKKITRTSGTGGLGIKDAHLLFLGSIAVSNVQDPDNGAGYSHCEFTLSTSSDEFRMLQANDYILTQSTDEYGRTSVLHCFGTVLSKNGSTGLVIIRDLQRGVTATNFTLFIYRPQQLIPVVATGNCTSGLFTITGVVIEDNATQLPTNIALNSPFFPEGTMLLSYDNSTTTATTSNPATATATNIDIVSSDWRALVYSGQPNPAQSDKVGWKKNDEAINVRQDIFNTLIKWVCIKTGVSGYSDTTRRPQFIAVEWYSDEFNTTADTSRTVESYFTFNFKVKVASDLAAFKIGTTNGGEEILSAQPVLAADGWVTVQVNFFDGVSTTVYFGGIGAVSTDIKIIKSDPVAIT